MVKNKLDLKYWYSKFDDYTDADIACIEEAFHTETSAPHGFKRTDKLILAEILLTGRKIFADNKVWLETYKVCDLFNKNWSVEPIFVSDRGNNIATWKYNYRKLVKAIPEGYLTDAIRNIYARLGYQLEESDITEIGASDNIYTKFLKQLKEDADGGFIEGDHKAEPLNYVDKTYLNMYLLFGKLGVEGRSADEALASIGELSCRADAYEFKPLKFPNNEIVAEAIDRSRGRMYPTFYESATILDL